MFKKVFFAFIVLILCVQCTPFYHVNTAIPTTSINQSVVNDKALAYLVYDSLINCNIPGNTPSGSFVRITQDAFKGSFVFRNTKVSGNGGTVISLAQGHLQRIYDQLQPQYFGAIPNDKLDDSDAFAAMFSSISGGLEIFIPPGVYLISKEIKIPIISNSHIKVRGYGALLVSNGNYPVFSSLVTTNQNDADMSASRILVFEGLKFQGNGNGTGLLFGPSYGSQIINCEFDNFKYATKVHYGLATQHINVHSTNCEIGFYLDFGNWIGANFANSGSNVSSFLNCRVYNKRGSYSSFYLRGVGECSLTDCVSEGYSPKYSIYYNAEKSTTAKNFYLRNYHSEENGGCDSAILYLDANGGIFDIDGLYTQYKNVLIDAQNAIGSPTINCRNLPWFPQNSKLVTNRNIAYGHPKWIFDASYSAIAKNSSTWRNDIMPYEAKFDQYDVFPQKIKTD